MKQDSALTYAVKSTATSALPRRRPCVPSLARWCVAALLFSTLSMVARAGWFDPKPDYAQYEVPLYQQVTNRIKAKILSRLGEGKNTKDRYFIIPFAYQNNGNDPGYSHSFMTVIRVLADNKPDKLTPGIKKRTYKNRGFQAFTISWLPHDFASNPNLCVFRGFGSRIFPTWNQCPLSQGRSFTLEETIKLAVNVKNAMCMWGPYEISKDGFDLAVNRLRLLEKGEIKYLADDRLTRKDKKAINCFHAMAGLDELFPNGGLFGTGFNMWGINGTSRVLIEYTAKANISGVLLEPVDEKKDRYGFVYSAKRDARCYNPVKESSAYQK